MHKHKCNHKHCEICGNVTEGNKCYSRLNVLLLNNENFEDKADEYVRKIVDLCGDEYMFDFENGEREKHMSDLKFLVKRIMECG